MTAGLTPSPIWNWCLYLLLLAALATVGFMAWACLRDSQRTSDRQDEHTATLYAGLVGVDDDVTQLWVAVFGDDGRRDLSQPVPLDEEPDTLRADPVDSWARQQWALAAGRGRHAAPDPAPAD